MRTPCFAVRSRRDANRANQQEGQTMKNALFRHVCRMLIVCMGLLPYGAHAGMIGADQVAAAAQSGTARDKVREFIGRSEVRDQLQNLGISREAAQARAGAMTEAEAASIAGRIDKLPAGGLISFWAVGVGLLVVELIWYFWVK
jgi:hypothetical protein